MAPPSSKNSLKYPSHKTETRGISLAVQWLRIHLSRQGTRIRSLIREDATGHGATESMCHNYCAHALEPVSATRSLCTTTRE